MSVSITDPKFDPCRAFIERSRRNGRDWDFLTTLNRTPEKLDAWLVDQEEMEGWPSLGTTLVERRQTWLDIVAGKRAAEERSISATRPLVIVGNNETEPNIRIPESEDTAWQRYRAHLEGQGWKKDAVDNIEASVLHILRRMRRNTIGQEPVKGLVVGHVQSGKTANMAGLVSMAADYRWNLFIVLSGTLENLRVQTRNRLVRDLYHPGSLSWKAIEHPSKNKPVGERAQDMQFQQGANDRHLIVSLKNASRLEALIGWITRHRLCMSQMRIVIIDDEADQGGINTASVSKEERSRINRLIVDLVNLPVQSVNYIAYTATPAANFLNEEPGDSLYPKDFIAALQQADEHFGPVQIFGLPSADQPPLGIVRDVETGDLKMLEALHKGDSDVLPDALEEATLWFLCCVAAMRYQGFRRPVSMLIHTSAAQQHHANVESALCGFLGKFADDPVALVARCAAVWDTRIADLDPTTFAERFSHYGGLSDLRGYPDFVDFASELTVLISTVTAIQLNEENERQYHDGIHLCVDNCANNGITDENEIRRLFYPDMEHSLVPDTATAFIVIGGGTLSRGLTIENLVSTFFLRASAQADSLMQMGRWFGYRKGYELLPRIWMPEATREKFEFMTAAEEDLRDDLQRFMYHGVRPSEFGPRVRVHPTMSWLRPTARNRMQSTVTADYDFSGVNRQTTLFHDGPGSGAIHRQNRLHTEAFLTGAGTVDAGRGSSLVWRGVNVETVICFLRGFAFHPGSQFFSEIEPFLEWLNSQATEAGYNRWNVVAAGSAAGSNRDWLLPGGAVGKVSRSRLLVERSDGAVSIGALRDPRDLLADAGHDVAGETQGTLNNIEVDRLRHERGVGGTPQLLLYLIDRNSSPQLKGLTAESGRTRGALKAEEDIVGISLWLPGVRDRRRDFAKRLTVRIRPELLADDDDLPGTGEEPAA
jgi:hypothetical protein